MKIQTTLFIACMLTSACVAADATTEIYKCIDADARISYSDKPCKGKSIIFKPKVGPKAKAGSKAQSRVAPKVDDDVDARRDKTQRLLRAYKEEREEKKQEAAELKAENEQRLKNCSRARSNYQKFLGAARVFLTDKDGNRVDFTDEERADATARAKAAIERWCD